MARARAEPSPSGLRLMDREFHDIDLDDALRRSGLDRPDHEPEAVRADRQERDGPLLIWHGEVSPEPPPMLVRGLLPQAQTAIVAGVYSSGKTFVVSDLAACVMLNVPFAGREIVRPGAVLWLASEGENEIDARIHAAATERSDGIAPGSLPFARQAINVPRLVEQEAESGILSLVTAFNAGLAERFPETELVLLVIDTLGSAAGFLDPNSAGETQRVMDMLRRVHKAVNALILVVDHYGKAVETGVMGSSAKAQTAEAVLAILADKTMEGEISNRRMTIAKFRSGTQGAVTGFRLRQVPVGAFGGTTCVVEWSDITEATATATPKPVKPAWTGNARVFKSAMERAMIDFGKTFRPMTDGPELKCVQHEQIRAEFYRCYPAENQPAKRQAFNRLRTEAVNKGVVASREVSGADWLWFVNERDTGRDSDGVL